MPHACGVDKLETDTLVQCTTGYSKVLLKKPLAASRGGTAEKHKDGRRRMPPKIHSA
jgi:hypothetical protein